MPTKLLPRYPIYIPSKGRSDQCFTAQALRRDGVPFSLVVEPPERDAYAAIFGAEYLLVLPWSGDDAARRAFCAERRIENGGLIAARNWIKEHATAAGYERHWQLDDNIRGMDRWWRGQRLPCAAGVALAAVEDFTDRYENIAIAGLNYHMFAIEKMAAVQVNCHVYSATLVLNQISYRWRITYNDDTDLCLQVLAGGWCTILVNVFLVRKVATMKIRGGNTDALYQGDGRLRMARSLERLWPGVVTTRRRFRRPQHVIKNAWKRFDTPLKLKPGIDLTVLPPVDEYGLELVAVKPVKSLRLRRLVPEQQGAA